MQRNNDMYKYIASYVDDFYIVARQHEIIIQHLEDMIKYKLKGTGKIRYHLKCNYFWDEDDFLCYAPKKYIIKSISNYMNLFGLKS